MHAASAALAADDPLARLASEYQSYLVGVRKLQYDSFRRSTTARSLTGPRSARSCGEHLGFTFGDFTAVRSAIQERYSRILTGLRDETGDIVMRCQAEGREPTDEEILAFRKSMSGLHVPSRGTRIVYRVGHRRRVEVEPARVEAVLDAFSIGFDGRRDAVATVASFLRGVNPLARTCLVRDADGNYLMTGQPDRNGLLPRDSGDSPESRRAKRGTATTAPVLMSPRRPPLAAVSRPSATRRPTRISVLRPQARTGRCRLWAPPAPARRPSVTRLSAMACSSSRTSRSALR